MAERLNWLATPLSADPFARALRASGVPEAFIRQGTVDPQVDLVGGGKGSLFDALEDLDSAACLAKVVELSSL
eukprot:7004321-Prymnesium_polylepis.1